MENCTKQEQGVSSTRIRCLLVEDETLISKMLISILKDVEFVWVKTWSEAEQIIRKDLPDLVLLDLDLPDSNINQTIQKIRAIPAPVIVLTAATGPEKVGVEAVKAGAKGCLFKLDIARKENPVRALYEEINLVLEKQKKKQEIDSLVPDFNKSIDDLKAIINPK